jgi:lipopolysaccharide/colanic/teichoic acid biosynthesis glycosyltransferase
MRERFGAGSFGLAATRVLDVVVAFVVLLLLSPLIAVLMLAIKLESAGPCFYRCRRVGRNGRELSMLKFRKMRSDAAGVSLTAPDDERFTRLGTFLAASKVDELPQLWNVLRGEMSLVGPRPESPEFVDHAASDYDVILTVRPGITGLSQLAFARESEILDDSDRVGDYLERLLPAKARIDRLFVERRSLSLYVRILWWTLVAVVLRRHVAVHRQTARLNLRRRPLMEAMPAGMSVSQ